MGAYAAWLAEGLGEHAAGVRGTATPGLLPRVMLVAACEPTPAHLTRLLGGVPRAMVLPVAPEEPLAGVDYYCFRSATNPICWDSGVDAALRDGIDTVAFLLPPAEVRGQTLMRLRRLG